MKSTRRGSFSVHRSEKTPGSKYSSTSGLSPRGHLERQAEFHASTQDEAWLSCPQSAGTLRSESEIRSTLRFLPQLEMRPSSNAPSPVESREAPPTSSFPGFSELAQQGTQGYNLGRLCVYTAGLPDSVGGMTIDRMCASSLVSIATAAKGIMVGEYTVVVAGGLESISLVQNKHKNSYRAQSKAVLAAAPTAYIQMIETAEIVSRRYGISREVQDEYALRSQQRTEAAQQAGRFADEIVPLATTRQLFDKEGNPAGTPEVTLEQDEGNRPGTTLENLAALKPVWKGGQWVSQGEFITAGNASQLSDGASAAVLMSRAEAGRRGLAPLGTYRGLAVAGCAADEMGLGPLFAIPKLLQHHGLAVGDIGLWEINEAFACQVVYCRDQLGIPDERLNVECTYHMARHTLIL